MDINYGEMFWFVAVTVSINCLVFVLCGTFEIIERFKLFENDKIQKKVSVARMQLCGLYNVVHFP